MSGGVGRRNGSGRSARRPTTTRSLDSRHQPVQRLPPADHAELLARRALLGRGVGLERVRLALQRIELHLELPHRPLLVGQLPAEFQPVERAVFTSLEGEPREGHGRGDPDQARARHNP